VALRVSGNRLENFYIKGFIVYGTSRNPERILNSVFPLVTLDVRYFFYSRCCIQSNWIHWMNVVVNNAGWYYRSIGRDSIIEMKIILIFLDLLRWWNLCHHKCAKQSVYYKYYFNCGIYGIPIVLFIQHQGALEW
jgi:hypothetical protein